MGRTTLFTAITDAFEETDYIVYPEPPETLVGRAIVISPRDPYIEYSTMGTLTTHLSVSVLVPRTHAPAMDAIDEALGTLWEEFASIGNCQVGDTHVGIIEEVGGVSYLAAMVSVSLV